MSNWPYTDEELNDYFSNPSVRRPGGPPPRRRQPAPEAPRRRGFRGYLSSRFDDPAKRQAAYALSLIGAVLVGMTLFIGVYFAVVSGDLPSFQQLDAPRLQLATVAYTSDGRELARYASQNRSWVEFDAISPHAINALIAVEDKRFYDHWGMDIWRTFSAIGQTVLDKLYVPGFRTQGGSTITQQLARNLYNEQIGKEQSLGRKLKEMVTAVQLERRYTKREILEMYLNTVEFAPNAWGIQAAAQTFFGKTAVELDVLESATLVGMLQAVSRFNPVRNPERAQGRRNVVMQQMVSQGFISTAFYNANREAPVVTDYRSSAITASIAPYFAVFVEEWLQDWARRNNRNIYGEGLVVYTTLDSRLQELGRLAVEGNMNELQAVVDYEWSRQSGYGLGTEVGPYVAARGHTPFAYFWQSQRDLVDSFIRDTERFRSLRLTGAEPAAIIAQLRQDQAYMDSLKAAKTRLESGLVAIDPRSGHVKAWVGGRDLNVDWYDHVAKARRQPGSTFKPFVYTAAIDNGYSPNYMLPDSAFTYRDPQSGQVWRPGNVGGFSGEMMTLRQALAHSVNTVTARLVTLIGPNLAAFYAQRMGIKSRLEEVPSLALGTSDVTLLELVSAFSTLANGGLYYEPTVVTRVEDRYGNVLYEAEPAPREALAEETAYTVVDMLRGAVDYGTAQRIRWQYGLRGHDLAGKTGTTQNSADGWFVLMHPELVTGAWVGFNDRRITFRSSFWGQGAHNALYLVGDFFRRAVNSPDVQIGNERFPSPEDYGLPGGMPIPIAPDDEAGTSYPAQDGRDRGRTGW
jgi:penicillin-binding protein 1A